MRFSLIRFATCVLSALAVLAAPAVAGAGIIWMHEAFSGAYHVDAGITGQGTVIFDQRDGGVPQASGLWGGDSVDIRYEGARADARMLLYSGDGGGEFQFDGAARNASQGFRYIGSSNARLSFTAPFTVDASDLFRTDFHLAGWASQGDGLFIEMKLRDDLGVLSQFRLLTQSYQRYDQYESLSALLTAGMTYYLDVNIRMTSHDSNFSTLTMDQFTHQLGPVPEPATLVLLGAGLAGVALRRRRKA